MRGGLALVAVAGRAQPAAEREVHPFVQDIVSARTRRGISQAEMARLCGWSRQQQKKLESGVTANPGVRSLATMAEALGLKMALVETTR